MLIQLFQLLFFSYHVINVDTESIKYNFLNVDGIARYTYVNNVKLSLIHTKYTLKKCLFSDIRKLFF